MALGDLLSSIDQNGFWQGMQNYAGGTNAGQAINGVFGSPSSQTNPAMSAPPIQSNHLDAPDSNGIRPFNDAGKQHLSNNIPQTQPPPDLSSLFTLPTSAGNTQQNNQSQQPQQSGSSKGTGKDLIALAALL